MNNKSQLNTINEMFEQILFKSKHEYFDYNSHDFVRDALKIWDYAKQELESEEE